jgi:hypothetical protein
MARRTIRKRAASRCRVLHVEPLEDRRLLNAGGLIGVGQFLGVYAPPAVAVQQGPGFQPGASNPPTAVFPTLPGPGTLPVVRPGFRPWHPPSHVPPHHVPPPRPDTDDGSAAAAVIQAAASRVKEVPHRDVSVENQGNVDDGQAADPTPVADQTDGGNTADALASDGGDGTDTQTAAPGPVSPTAPAGGTGGPDGRAPANAVLARVLARVGAEADKGLAGTLGEGPTGAADGERTASPAAAPTATTESARVHAADAAPVDHTLVLAAGAAGPTAERTVVWVVDPARVDAEAMTVAANAEAVSPAAAEVADAAAGGAAALPEGLPRQADLIAGFVPLDATAIERAVQDFLGHVEQVGGESAHLLTRLGVPPWVLATVIGTTACGLSWRRRKGRAEVVLYVPPGDDDTTSTCLPGSAGGLAAEDA